jgi:hypothetical protein
MIRWRNKASSIDPDACETQARPPLYHFPPQSLWTIKMSAKIGILAFGSLIDSPGKEIEELMVGQMKNVRTPFCVEFARSSGGRSGAPTLVPMTQGGNPAPAWILLLDTTEQEAKDCLWRREINKVGQSGHYVEHRNPGPNTLIIGRYKNLKGIPVVLAARFPANITPLTPERLAELAIESARCERGGRDGITYLIDAKRNGIVTPLSPGYEQAILRRTGASSLEDALRALQA